ncbi:MAG: glycosyl hydrolase family 18 protein [Chitinophagaceae bacterium]|jgi:chitinase|nr:glycosyl hydrolase family 18 protein [Chitinophagaceae bacterium]
MKWAYLILFLMYCSGLQSQDLNGRFEVIAYYTGNGMDVEKYSLSKITQIIFSFLHLKDDTLYFDNEEKRETLKRLVALKEKYPGLKVLISLGGWSGCKTCSDVFSDSASRKNFAASVRRIMDTYKVDGIDLDWEYPAIEGFPGHPFKPQDRENFTDLIFQIRNAIGEKGELSFAAGGFTQYLEKSVDWKMVMPMVNRVNLMTYDLVHGYSTTTGHHTPLYSTPQQLESTDNCVQWLIKAGVPPEKLIIGSAFYARIWEGVSRKDWGLYKEGKFLKAIGYKDFNRLEPDSGWAHQWDNIALAPYAFHKTKNYFATYDNGMSVFEKVQYAFRHHLGGIMFWELSSDIPGNGLLDQMADAVKRFFKQ